MHPTLVLDKNQREKLVDFPLSTLKILLDSGLIEIKEMMMLELPCSKTDAFLFLQKQKQMQQTSVVNDEYVVSIIDEILINPNTISEGKDEGHFDVVLNHEIIETIR